MNDITASTTGTATKRGRGRPRKDWTVRSVLAMSLAESFSTNLWWKSDRDIEIIERRLGMGRPKETLEAIGQGYGLTREAMRQIVKRFAREVFADDAGIRLLLDACQAATSDGPVAVADLDGAAPIFFGLAADPAVLSPALSLLEGLVPDIVLPHVRRLGGEPTLIPMTEGAWDAAVDRVCRILRLSTPEGRDGRLASVLSGMPEGFRDAIIEAANREDGSLKHGDIHACVRLLLEDAEGPVALREIADRIRNVTGKEMRLHRVVTIANNVGVRVARGIYTSPSRVDVSPEEAAAIKAAVLGVMRAGPAGRQWHAAEFIERIAGKDGIRADLTPDLLGYAIKESPEIRSLGRAIFELAEMAPSRGSRSHLRDLIVSIIENAGRPMSKSEIRQAVTAVRGIGPGFSIVEGRDIVRIAGALYATPEVAERYRQAFPTSDMKAA